MENKVRSVECEAESVKCEVKRGVECAVWSVKRGV